MFTNPTPARCAECGQLARDTHFFAVCSLCFQLFCQRHLTFRNGVPSCAECEEERQSREQSGGISDADESRVVALLLTDIAATLGSGYEYVVRDAAARIRLFALDPNDFEQRVIDDVQQDLHDSYADTTWPTCPEHRRHPLWCLDGWWTCDKTGRQIARFGSLANSV